MPIWSDVEAKLELFEARVECSMITADMIEHNCSDSLIIHRPRKWAAL